MLLFTGCVHTTFASRNDAEIGVPIMATAGGLFATALTVQLLIWAECHEKSQDKFICEWGPGGSVEW